MRRCRHHSLNRCRSESANCRGAGFSEQSLGSDAGVPGGSRLPEPRSPGLCRRATTYRCREAGDVIDAFVAQLPRHAKSKEVRRGLRVKAVDGLGNGDLRIQRIAHLKTYHPIGIQTPATGYTANSGWTLTWCNPVTRSTTGPTILSPGVGTARRPNRGRRRAGLRRHRGRLGLQRSGREGDPAPRRNFYPHRRVPAYRIGRPAGGQAISRVNSRLLRAALATSVT
jgi:hypothetical protein